MAEGALADARAKSPAGDADAASTSAAAALGTSYTPGMLGRPGWREKGLVDPAAVLPVKDRELVGVPHSTKSVILEEPFGMGRRWSTADRSAALFYQLYPEHKAWEPPGGRVQYPEVSGASAAHLDDGRSLVFVADHHRSVVLEVTGLDDSARATLARSVAAHLS
jgi:hypothetical protein